MSNHMDNRGENWALAQLLAGRYGTLALARAAGGAAEAQRRGDSKLTALWLSVVSDLRQTMAINA